MTDEILNEEEGGGGESNVTAGVEKTELPLDLHKRKKKDDKDAELEESIDQIFESIDVLDEMYRGLQRGESRGRFYRSSSGDVYDDEGNKLEPIRRRVGTRYYHRVPFAKKDEAKREGMRFDGQKKKWYHTDATKSKNSNFPKG